MTCLVLDLKERAILYLSRDGDLVVVSQLYMGNTWHKLIPKTTIIVAESAVSVRPVDPPPVRQT